MIKPTVQTTFTDTLSTLAEQRAEAAEQLVPFSGFKLLHVKRQLSIMLSLIGREKLFDQYTRHDITHINELLEMIDWVVPESTRGDMTPVDWLLVVLAIYFHDFGMLVTPLEYAKRYESGFAKFRDESLLGGDSGKDYAAKVAELPAEDAERFLYQEFVRFTHAARVRAWVTGEAPKSLGITNQIMEELDGLLDVLPEAFRRDLGTVCESHHLDDLADLKKYRVSQPYGNASSATANVQYAAIVLRTVDLLHMTSDRTPSVAFKLISPTDPISQREWAKQLAVRAVRPRPARNKDGEVDESIQPDSIEVHALFRNAEGFFALTAFLRYVQGQLRKSHEWVKASHREGAANYKFPWRDILDEQVEAQGFINKNFEFTLDQTRILDLLTGHTLYNDTSIVLRELVQNGIDAVRAQRLTERTSASLGTGAITIRWNTKTRVLDVQDDGTGMTQDIIEAHLLKVGSSRYQDANFKKKYPAFAPISRFGIGILSSFMVADSVDIFTAHPDEPENRHLSLRTVHGKYLIKLISKDNEVSTSLGFHGTLVRLQIRHTAKLPNVLDTIRRWIVVPNCNVEVIIDGAAAVRVGFDSPKDALVAQLRADRLLDDGAEPNPKKPGIRIEQVERDGITLAYDLQWSDYFKEWSFLQTSREETMLGTCIEGIRVEFVTPGFNEGAFYAIANARGPSAPRTNVARSGLEKSPEFMKALATIYSLYCDHVRAELVALRQERNFSLTWAAREARYLLASLIIVSDRLWTRPKYARALGLLQAEVDKVPFLVVEHAATRRAITPEECLREPYLWSIDCELIRSAETLLGESTSDSSMDAVLKALGATAADLPSEPVLCAAHPLDPLARSMFDEREADRIVIWRDQRRVDVRWARLEASPRWLTFPRSDFARTVLERTRATRDPSGVKGIYSVRVAARPVEISGLGEETAVRAHGITWIKHDWNVAQFLVSLIREVEESQSENDFLFLAASLNWVNDSYVRRRHGAPTTEGLIRHFASYNLTTQTPNAEKFMGLAMSSSWQLFDPTAWLRAPHDFVA